MYQILQKFDIHWHDGGPSIAMMYHLRRVSDLLCNWKSCLLCYMKDVVLHCSIFFKWNKLVRVRVRVRVSKRGPRYVLHTALSEEHDTWSADVYAEIHHFGNLEQPLKPPNSQIHNTNENTHSTACVFCKMRTSNAFVPWKQHKQHYNSNE